MITNGLYKVVRNIPKRVKRSARWKRLITIMIQSVTMRDVSDYLELSEVHALMSAAEAAGNTRDYLIIRVLWHTGARIGELLHIRPCDLEPHNDMIRIMKAKGGKQRRVLIDSETLSMLAAYIEDNNIANDSPIFPLTRQWVNKILNRYAKAVDISPIHPHTFRHSFAIQSVRNGVDVRRLQQALGHSNISTTAVYLRFNDKDVKEAFANVPF